MKKVETILIIIILISLILKFMDVYISNIILYISVFLLAFVYFYLSVLLFNNIPIKQYLNFKNYKKIEPIKLILSILTGVGVAALCIGILFKLQLVFIEENFNLNLYFGNILSFIILIVTLLKLFLTKERYYFKLISRLIIFCILGFFFLLIKNTDIVEFQYKKYPDYINAYKEYYLNPQNLELKEKKEIEYKKVIERMK